MNDGKKYTVSSALFLLLNYAVATEYKEIKYREAARQETYQSFSKLLSSFTLPSFSAGKPNATREQKYIIDNFGNKTFNLCVLHALSKQLSSPALPSMVPPFCGISHSALSVYLNNVMNLDDLWHQFVSYQGSDKTLNPRAASSAGEIREGILKAFEDSAKMPEFIKAEISELIKNYSGFLMVRSSGYEDRIDIANAGGNESVPAVEANLSAIWRAMGVVVSSYFSEKSLQQRLLAGDTITGPYFVPVLVQHMVGEKLWDGKTHKLNEIPVSGVLFTQEAEGNTPGIVQIQTAFGHNQGVVNSLVAVDTFYVGPSGIIHPIIREKKERLVPAKIEGMFTLIMVPNEFSSVPSLAADSVHNLDRSARVIQTVYKTPMDVEFVIMNNKGKPTLYLVQARPLVRKSFTQQPSYISDAYLDSLTPNQIKRGISIGVAGGFIRYIENNNQLIMRSALPQALNAYHDDPARERIKGIIVSTMAPATSHEATQFRSYMLPILVVTEAMMQSIDQLHDPLLFDVQRALIVPKPGEEKEYKSLIMPGWYTHPIPLQLSLLSQYALPRQAPLVAKLSGYIKSISWNKTDDDDTKESYRTLLARIKKSSDKTEITQVLKRILHRLSQLTTIKTATSVAGKTGAGIDYLQQYLTTDDKEKQGLLHEAQLIMSNATLCALEILYTLDHRSGISENDARLAQLYAIKFLEAIILQQHDPAVINDYSYVQLRTMYKQELEAIEKLTPALPKPELVEQTVGATTFEYLVQLGKLDKLTLNTLTHNAWNTFIGKLTKEIGQADTKERLDDQVTVKRFSTMIHQLQKLDVLDVWINTSFKRHIAQAEKSALDASKSLLAEFENKQTRGNLLSNKSVIDWVSEHKDMLTRWSTRIDEWGDPETTKFTKLMDQFQKQFVTEFISGKDSAAQKAYAALLFTETHAIAPLDYNALISYSQEHAPLTTIFNKADKLGKLILLQFLREIIDVYDKTLKGLTGSPLYKDKNLQAQRFAQLLAPYLVLMEEMITLIRDQESSLMLNEAWGNWTFKKYLGDIRTLYAQFAQKAVASFLKASRTFSVGAAQIGSKVDFSRAQPHTLEDIFTLAHQNMLTALSVLNKEYGITKEMLPSLVQNVCESIEKITIHEEGALKSYLVGIEYQFPHVSVFYNIPLRQHSSTFEIRYNKNKPEQAILDCKFFGHNEGNRMNGLVAYAYLASFASELSFATKPFTTADQAGGKDFSALTEFAWGITNKTNLAEVTHYIEMFGAQTLTFTASTPFMFQNINKIHTIIHGKWKKVFESLDIGNNLTRLSPDETKDLLQNGLSQLPNSFFEQTTFFNAWFIRQFIQAGMYDKALMIIRASFTTMIKENNYSQLTNLTVEELLPFCLGQLQKLFAIPELQDPIIKLLNETICSSQNIRNVASAPKTTTSLITLALMLVEKKPEQATFELFERIINEPTTNIIFLNPNLGPKVGIAIAQFKGETAVQQWQQRMYPAALNEAKRQINQTAYYNAAETASRLLRYASKDSNVYAYILDIARELCKAQKIYEGMNPVDYAGVPERIPGLQYYYAGKIASELMEAGQNASGEEIFDTLHKIRDRLRKEPSSSDQEITLQYLDKGLELIQEKRQ